MDISGDKRPEALFVDTDAACYKGSGRYFAALVKEGTAWRSVINGTGSIQALSSKTVGWMDMRVTDSGCVRDHHYDGRTYKAATSCTDETVATGPQTAPSVPGASAGKTVGTTLQAADATAAFKAAAFTKRGNAWRSTCKDPSTTSYSPGAIDSVADLNGDGLPEAVITEGGTFCYGNTGQGYWLVSKVANGGWRLITKGVGIPEFLKTKGADGWPDIGVGGP